MTRPAAEDPDAIPIVLACRTVCVPRAVDLVLVGPGPLEPGDRSAERAAPLSIELRCRAPDFDGRPQERRTRRVHRQGPPHMPSDRGNKHPCLRHRRHDGCRISGHDVDRRQPHLVAGGRTHGLARTLRFTRVA